MTDVKRCYIHQTSLDGNGRCALCKGVPPAQPKPKVTTRPIYANHDDIVEIFWRQRDGQFHREKYTCPPTPTVAARTAENVQESPVEAKHAGEKL